MLETPPQKPCAQPLAPPSHTSFLKNHPTYRQPPHPVPLRQLRAASPSVRAHTLSRSLRPFPQHQQLLGLRPKALPCPIAQGVGMRHSCCLYIAPMCLKSAEACPAARDASFISACPEGSTVGHLKPYNCHGPQHHGLHRHRHLFLYHALESAPHPWCPL